MDPARYFGRTQQACPRRSNFRFFKLIAHSTQKGPRPFRWSLHRRMFATPFIKTTLLQVLRALTAIAAASSACRPSKLWVVLRPRLRCKRDVRPGC
jgi:hypothetical protein